MQNITLHSNIGPDGILHLNIPFKSEDANVKVEVIIKPIMSKPKISEELGYPPGFFEEVAGGWAGEPLERAEQGEFEQREEIKWDSC